MAKYRQIHITFWQDPFIEELEPLEKYFYLYLMTNSKTSQCGCYEISMKLIRYETGLSQKEIDDNIKLLEKNEKIKFNKETNEFLILNWLKHNSFTSPKVKSCILKELENIKFKDFIQYINYILKNGIGMDSLSIVYNKSIDTGTQQEEEQEQKEEQEEDKKNEDYFTEEQKLKINKNYPNIDLFYYEERIKEWELKTKPYTNRVSALNTFVKKDVEQRNKYEEKFIKKEKINKIENTKEWSKSEWT